MLDYVYSGQLEKKHSSSSPVPKSGEPAKLTIAVSRKLLYAAEKYKIRNLKEECLTKLLEDVDLETVGELAVLAYEFDEDSGIQKKSKSCRRR